MHCFALYNVHCINLFEHAQCNKVSKKMGGQRKEGSFVGALQYRQEQLAQLSTLPADQALTN